MSCLYGYGLFALWSVTAVALCLFLLFPCFFFGFYFTPIAISFSFGGSLIFDSVLGIRVGGVLLFFTMSCNNPITPKRFYSFYYYFTSYLGTLIPTFYFLALSILDIDLLPRQRHSLYVCLLRLQTVSNGFFSNVLYGRFLFYILQLRGDRL